MDCTTTGASLPSITLPTCTRCDGRRLMMVALMVIEARAAILHHSPPPGEREERGKRAWLASLSGDVYSQCPLLQRHVRHFAIFIDVRGQIHLLALVV